MRSFFQHQEILDAGAVKWDRKLHRGNHQNLSRYMSMCNLMSCWQANQIYMMINNKHIKKHTSSPITDQVAAGHRVQVQIPEMNLAGASHRHMNQKKTVKRVKFRSKGEVFHPDLSKFFVHFHEFHPSTGSHARDRKGLDVAVGVPAKL